MAIMKLYPVWAFVLGLPYAMSAVATHKTGSSPRILPGKTAWKPPSAPIAFKVDTTMSWPWEGTLVASANDVPVTIARDGNNIGIYYTGQDHSAFMPLYASPNSTAYELQWWGSTSSLVEQTYNCSSIPGGLSYWGSQVGQPQAL